MNLQQQQKENVFIIVSSYFTLSRCLDCNSASSPGKGEQTWSYAILEAGDLGRLFNYLPLFLHVYTNVPVIKWFKNVFSWYFE